MAGRTTLTALGVAAGVTALLIAAGVWLATRAGVSADGVAHALIGDAMLAYPRAYARNQSGATTDRLERLDLAATFPDFRPAADVRGVSSNESLAERTARTIFVVVAPDDRSLDPAERPAKLYAPFLDPVGFAKPSGLVARRFQDSSPYQGEELFMTPPEGRAFWARCPAPDAKTASDPAGSCLTEMRLDGLNLTVRFDPSLLPEWERLRGGVATLLAGMRR